MYIAAKLSDECHYFQIAIFISFNQKFSPLEKQIFLFGNDGIEKYKDFAAINVKQLNEPE